MAVSTGAKLQALAKNPRALALAGAAVVGVIYLRKHQAAAAADTSATDLQGSSYPVDPSASGSFGDVSNAGLGATGTVTTAQGAAPFDATTAGGDNYPAPTDQIPTGPNAFAAGFWWGGKFWRPGQRAAFERWLRTHGADADLWASRHPGAAAVLGIEPPPPRGARAGNLAHLARATPRARGPALAHPPSHTAVDRRATLLGGVTVHTKAKPAKPRHRLPSGERKAHPKIDSEATAHATHGHPPAGARGPVGAGGARHQAPRSGPGGPSGIRPGPASRLLSRPAGPSTRPRRHDQRQARRQRRNEPA